MMVDPAVDSVPHSGPRGPRALTPLTTLLILLALATCAPMTRTEPSPDPIERTEQTERSRTETKVSSPEEWVETSLARLTLRQKVGQLIAPWLAGNYLSTDSDEYEKIYDWVVNQGIGGLVISIGPPLEVAAKLDLIQDLAEIPLLITADMEHGPRQRLDGGVILPNMMLNGGGTAFPPLMGVGATGDPAHAYELGRITALEARAVGIGMIFAPVVDINNNPSNPVINTRSYGADPELVSHFAAAHIRGLQDHGILAVAKHFPGHGDTGIDSHIDLPMIGADRARADSVELVPFRAAIAAGVTGVMSAHITFPALTGDSTPATLSPMIMTDLLVDELGFDGLVITDALDMGAIVRRYGAGETMIRALEAGADLLIMPTGLPDAIDEVVDAVREGRITEERIDQSVRKLLHLKAGLGLHERERTDPTRIAEVVGTRSHELVAEGIARASITLPRDDGGLVPLLRGIDEPPRILSITYAEGVDPLAGRTFDQRLRRVIPKLRSERIGPETAPSRLDSLRTEAERADLVLFSSYVRVVTGRGRVSLPEWVAELVSDLTALRPTILLSFGNPYLLQQVPEVGTYLTAWGPGALSQEAAAAAILGEAQITGRLPISIPPYHEIGEGLTRSPTHPGVRAGITVDPEEVGMDPEGLAELDRIIENTIARGAIPGAAIAIGRYGHLVRLRGYGRLDPRPGYGPATDSSIYDLASLTKVIGTTTAVMILTEEGELDLDALVKEYLPEWGGRDPAKDRVTIRHLLTHTAGFPPFEPLWRELRGREAFIERIASAPLQYQPGEREVYSDFGLILLGVIIERIAGKPLDEFLEERLFHPLGLRETGFNPRTWEADTLGILLARKARPEPAEVAAVPAVLARIAPTEIDTIYRMTHIHAVVHDENAYAIGGVAGHAGLFSSARDLAVFAEMIRSGGLYHDPETGESRRLLRPETIRRFATRRPGGTSRALGWDTPAGRSSAGDYFTARSFGHTGFTGTSIWIDPERDLFVVLLTNRVNPSRENRSHIELRRAVHDAAQRAITDQPVTRRR